MLKIITIAIITIALNGVTLVSANSANRYGAIAYSPRTGATGWSHKNNRTRYDAEQRALNGCYKYADDCRIATWTRNACTALAVGRNGSWGTGWNVIKARAKSRAIRACRKRDSGCKIKRWICT